MITLLDSIKAEYQRYKALADAAMAQLSEKELSEPGAGNGNSIATIAWHISGNLASRFTDFLLTDGEKTWRNREEEFAPRTPAREELKHHWEHGWKTLFDTLSELTENHLQQSVLIRRAKLQVHEALHRSLAHTSYHVGQIVYLAKAFRGAEWKYLSIPPGASEAWNRNPTSEYAAAHAAKLKESMSE